MISVHSTQDATPWIPIESVRHLFGYLDILFWTMGILERYNRAGTLELEFGTPDIWITEMDFWKSGFLEWISGSPVFSNGYLGPENGYPEVRSPFRNPAR
jgi:hypothetical protein